MRLEHLVLVAATVLAALGQILFKLGASDRTELRDFFNWAVLAGLACYGAGTLAWIFALSKLPLKVVYPYTGLTFVLVYVAAVGFFGERLHTRAILGVCCVLAGLFLLTAEKSA